MNKKIVTFGVLAVALAAAGCDWISRKTDTGKEPERKSQALTSVDCKEPAGGRPRDCQVDPNDENKKCDDITIDVSGNDIIVDPLVLNVVRAPGGSGSNRKVRIRWALQASGAEFNKSLGDGITFKNDLNGEFVVDPAPPAHGKFHGRKFQNVARSQTYRYSIQFHIGDKMYACDPLINNSGSN